MYVTARLVAGPTDRRGIRRTAHGAAGVRTCRPRAPLSVNRPAAVRGMSVVLRLSKFKVENVALVTQLPVLLTFVVHLFSPGAPA